MRKNQKGIAHLLAVFIVLIIAIIGLVGWRIWDINKKSDAKSIDTQVNTTANNVTTDTVSKAPTLPEGFVSYKNSDLGFSFDYPKIWGDAIANNQTGETGSGVYITFTSDEKVSVSAVSKDYTPYGMGFECNAPYNFATAKKPDLSKYDTESTSSAVVSKSSDYIVVRKFISDGCTGSYSYLTGAHAIDGKTNGLFVMYKVELNRVVDLAEYAKDEYQFISKPKVNDFVTFVKSISEN